MSNEGPEKDLTAFPQMKIKSQKGESKLTHGTNQ